MNMLHLRYAVEVAKTGSITQAADNLYMGQPNLSRAIRELEDSVGFSIFKRSPKGMTPTPKGEEFLRYARNILSQIEELESRFSSNYDEMRSFRISVCPACYIMYGFAHFLQAHPVPRSLEMVFSETDPMQVIRNTAEQNFSLGILRFQKDLEPYFLGLLEEKELSWSLIWEFDCQALFSSSHPLADADPLTYEDLAAHSLELDQNDLSFPVFSHHTEQTAPLSSCVPPKLYINGRGSRFDLLNLLPHAFLWASPVPAEMLRQHHLIQRKCVNFTRQMKDILIFPRHHRFSQLEEQFLCALYEVRDSLQHQ